MNRVANAGSKHFGFPCVVFVNIDDVLKQHQTILTNVDTSTCAWFVGLNRSETNDDIKMFAALTPEQLDTWFDIILDAVVAEVRQVPKPQFSDAAGERALAEALNPFSREDRERFLRAFLEPQKASTEDSHRYPQVLPGAHAVLFTNSINPAGERHDRSAIA